MATPDGLRNRFDVDAEAYTNLFNNDNNPSLHRNNVRFGTDPLPVPSGITNFWSVWSGWIMVGLVAGVAFGIISGAYSWWYYNTTLLYFFDTQLPSIFASIVLYSTYFTSIFISITNIETTLNVSSINGTGTIPASRVLYTNGASFMVGGTTAEDGFNNLVIQFQNGTIPANRVTYTNGAAPFMSNVTESDMALDNLVGEAIVHTGQITTLQGQTTRLLATTSLEYYLSVTYGNDLTCDGSKSLPCASVYRLLQLLSNVTGQYSQISLIFDNGFYQETNFVALKPNLIFVGNEGGTLLSFYGGLGLDGGSWAATGTGFVTFLRFASLQCVVACDFDMSAAVPSGPIFSIFNFYNTTLYPNANMLFKRRTDTSSYYAVYMESVVVNAANTIVFQDLTYVSWSLSGDNYALLYFNYNSTSTYGSGVPIVNMNGLVSHNLIVMNNYAVGVIVDWSLMGVINRDAATLTRNYLSGASINVHGDIHSLGSINGGLLTTGAGSGTMEYLTNAIGLGVDLTVPADWTVPLPTNQQEVNDQLASRNRPILSKTIIFYNAADACTNGIPGVSCQFFPPAGAFSVNTVQGDILFDSSGVYIGLSPKTFVISISTTISYTYAASVVTQIIFTGAFFPFPSPGSIAIKQAYPVNGAGATDFQTVYFERALTLNNGDFVFARFESLTGLQPSAASFNQVIMSYTEML